jgi:hypothetical protein
MDHDSSLDSVPDARRSRLRSTIAAIEGALARLPLEVTNDNGATPTDGLRASVADLVGQLALGPEPEYQRCSVCRHLCMSGATACGHCWTKLRPAQSLEGVAIGGDR